MALPMKPIPMKPELRALLDAAKDLPPMTPAQLREQRISWAYRTSPARWLNGCTTKYITIQNNGYVSLAHMGI